MSFHKSRKKITLFLIILLLVILSACQSDQQGLGGDLDQNIAKSTEEKGNDENQVKLNKKTLVWYVYNVIHPETNIDEQIYVRLNEILQEKGANYSIELVSFEFSDLHNYYDHLANSKKEGQQADLIMTGFGGIVEIPNEEDEDKTDLVHINTNIEAVRNDLLEPLDDYFKTDEGQQLYQQYEVNVWERVKISETIYGISNSIDIYSRPTLFMNSKKAQEMDIEIPEKIESLDQVEEIIEKNNAKFETTIPFAYLGHNIRELTEYSYFENGIAVDYDSDGIPYAFNPFEKEEVTQLIDKLSTFFMKNYWEDDSITYDQVNNGEFLFLLESNLNPLNYYDNTLFLESGQQVIAEAYELNQRFIDPLLNNIIGISSWSEYKEEAFDFLFRLNTDPELSNLLYYGVEDEHYELLDGLAVPNHHDKRVPGYFSPVNQLITHPRGNEPKNKEEIMSDWHAEGVLSPLIGFELDKSRIVDALEEIEEIYDDYWELWSVQDTDINDQIESVNQALHDAGINGVLEEINAQLKLSWEEKQK